MKQLVYIDTSVFGGYYDEEFSAYTIPLFDRFQKGDFKLLFSEVTQEELVEAPIKVRELVNSLKLENTILVETNDEAVELAKQYIVEKVVGQTSFADCLHIALATVYRADYLISWNFKHIVNVQRIRGYNAINIKSGYKELEIRSPRDFMTYDENHSENF